MFSHHFHRWSVPCHVLYQRLCSSPRSCSNSATYAYGYLDVAKRLTSEPVKQAVMTASALLLVYGPHLLKSSAIENYSHQEYLHDLIRKCEKDIRLCLGQLNELVKNVSIDLFICRTRVGTRRSIGFHRSSSLVEDRSIGEIVEGFHHLEQSSSRSIQSRRTAKARHPRLSRSRFRFECDAIQTNVVTDLRRFQHSLDIDYTLMIPDLFQLHLSNFYL